MAARSTPSPCAALVRSGPASALALLAGACTEPPPPVVVRDVVEELYVDETAWTVVQRREDVGPHLGPLVPSDDEALEKRELPSLVLPPPAAVRLRAPATDGPFTLSGFAAPDRSALAREDDAAPPADLEFGFEVLVDGELAWSESVRVGRLRGEPVRWLALGGGDGVLVPAAAEVELRTRVRGHDGAALDAGFGRPRLERVREVASQRATPSRPNVVLVVMDTLRADNVSHLGAEGPWTPRLDALADRGVTYTRAYASSSWTWPSTASILTGLQVDAHGVRDTATSYLSGELETLAEAFGRAGFATGGFVGNPLIVPPRNFDQGFQTFEHTRAGEMIDARDLVPGALEWAAEQGDRRFFLYLHPVDPHEPHDPDPAAAAVAPGEPPAGYRGMLGLRSRLLRVTDLGPFDAQGNSIADRYVDPAHAAWMPTSYARAVWTGDLWLGKLLDGLAALGLDGRTVVAFTSDHGEELLDHGMLLHGHSIYEELVRAPLVLAGPGVPSGVRVDRAVSNRHVAPTLARLAGVPWPDDADALDLARPDAVADAPVFFSSHNVFWNGAKSLSGYGVRRGDWVLHYAPRGAGWGDDPAPAGEERPEQLRLFDLATDPHEHHDVSREHPELAAELLDLLLDRLAEDTARGPKNTLDVGDETRSMLEELGYLED